MLTLNMLDGAPNLYSALIVLFQTLGTMFAVWVAYRQTISKVASRDQVNAVHETVNGNFTRERDRAEKYAAKLRAAGIDPDTDEPGSTTEMK